MQLAYAGQDVQAWKPTTRYERKWMHFIEPASRSRVAMEEMNRLGLDTFRQRGMPEPIREIVKQVATSRRVSIRLLASASRMRVAVLARREAMYRIKARNPEKTSASQIARWFDRDHSVVCHGIASHAEDHNLPNLVGFDIVKRRARLGVSL